MLQRLSSRLPAVAGALRTGLAAALLLPGMAMATVTINHQFTPQATIAQGDVTTYRITIANSSNVQLTNAAATSLLGPDITIASPGVTSTTCTGGTVTAVEGSSTVQLTGGTVPAQVGNTAGECTVDVSVTSTVPGNHTVTIPKDTAPTPTVAGFQATENGTTVFNSTDANVTLLVTLLAPPTGSKSYAPTPAYVGKPVTLTIQLSNPASNTGKTMPLTSFTDNLPSGMLVAPVPNASAVCAGSGFAAGTLTATAGASSITLDGGTIGVAGTCTITVDVVVNSITGTSQTFTNSLPAGAIGNSRGLSSPSFSQNLVVNAPVALNKSFNPIVIPVGQPSAMTIVVTNNGATALTNAGFTDSFPAGLKLAAAPNATASCTGGINGTVTATAGASSLQLSGATVPAGGTCTVTANVTADSEGAYANAIPANTVTNAEGIGSPAASATLTAYGELRVSKSVSPTSIGPGQWAQFSITVQNYSGAAVTGASLRDDLPQVPGSQMVLDYSAAPSGCSFAFGSSSASQNQDGAPSLVGTGGTIPAGTGTTPGSCTVTFRARVPENTAKVNFINSLPIGAVGIGPGMQNTNTASSTVAIVDAVVLGKAFNPSSIAQGQTSVLTLTLANRYVSALGVNSLTDNLPAGVVLAANPAATNTCGGALQAAPGDNKIVLTGAAVAARPDAAVDSSCTVTARVTGSALGTYTNTITPAQLVTASTAQIAADVSANLTITAGLSATKSFNPTSAAQGGLSRATVRVTNQTNAQLTGVSINDSGLGGGLSLANPANAASSCGGATVLTANPGSTGARLDGVVLPAGASCDLSFDVVANGAGPWTNTIPVNQITSAEGAYNSVAVTATLGQQSAQLALNKSFNPVIVTGNQPSLLTIDVVNTSSTAIAGTSFTDAFPKGIVVYSVPDAQTTCVGGTVAATPGGGLVSLTGATLAPNASCQVKVTVTSVEFLNLTNTIPASAVKSQGGYTNAQPTSATLSTLEGLGVSKGFEPAYITPGQTSRLKIRLANTYNPNVSSALTGVSFTDVLPAGLNFANNPNATTTCSSGTITVAGNALTLSGATLVPNGTCELLADVTTTVPGFYLNQLEAGAVTTDQKVTNLVPAESTLNAVTAPTIAKQFAPTTVTVGQSSLLTVTITNPASVALTGVSLTDNLPPGLAVFNPANTSTSCVGGAVTALPGSAKVTLNGASVPANGNCQFRVAVVASEPGVLTNTIAANAIQSNEGLTNGNPTDAPLTVLAPPTVSKAFSPAQIAANGTSTLRIRLENSNAAAITLTAALVDALPGNVLVASPPNINGSVPGGETACTAASITAVAEAINLAYANGAAIPPGGCTITVDVTSAMNGAYLNTIAAGQLKTTAGDNPEPAIATLGVGQPAAPTLVKSFSPTTIDVGGASVLTIVLGNPNATAVTLTSPLTDTLPANVLVATPANIGGTCTVAQVTASGSAVTYASGATIPANGCSISVRVTSATAGSYTNTIAAGALVTDAGTNPTPTQAALVVKAATEPSVLKAFAPSTINPGSISRLTITLSNGNPGPATLTAALVDTLPANVLVATPANIGGTCTVAQVSAAGSAVTYASGATIPANGCTIQVDVTSSVSGGPYVNTIPAGALQTDLGNNGAPAVAELLVNPGQPPSVSKAFVPASIAAGGISTLTISLGNGNAGSATLTAALVDNLPAPVVVAPTPMLVVSGGCSVADVVAVAGASSVTVRSGTIIPAGGCAISVRVTASTAGTYTNTIPAGSLQTDLGNNATPAQATLTVPGAGGVAALSGNVYHDRNDNGAIDAGEEGIAGVELRLSLLTGNGLVVVGTTTTDANGHYSFTNLVPGTYTVTEVQPAGWNDGKDTAGSKGGSTSVNDVISGIALVAGDNATDYNFGERRPTNVAGIPTLNPWALLLLSLALGWMAVRTRGVRLR
ncbi:IPTL-CTERM sorting domain-containing protein [Xylophilus sp. GW821-FHT01B05]